MPWEEGSGDRRASVLGQGVNRYWFLVIRGIGISGWCSGKLPCGAESVVVGLGKENVERIFVWVDASDESSEVGLGESGAAGSGLASPASPDVEED